jgi:hypothetical protein
MLFNYIRNNLHKKNANYRKKCIFLVQNRMCALLGMEVDETYKGVVIKNGQKTIQ